MGTTGKVVLAVVIALFIAVGSLAWWIISIKFEASRYENQIGASNQNLENVHSSVNKILQTSGITVKNFGETKINAIREAVKRYADKPQLMLQFVQENPQQIDSKVWEKFQDQVEVQYSKFETEQKDKISKTQAYKDWLSGTARGAVAGMVFSYPKPETLAIMNQVISTGETKETFKTGVDKSVDPFAK